MLWTDVPIHFIDFEGSLMSGVLEYGIVTLSHGTVSSVSTRLCGATGRIRAEDAAVHGLDERAVGAQPPLSADWEIFAGLRSQGPFAAHYAQAENSLLKSVWPYTRKAPDFARPGYDTSEWGPWVDTGRLCAEFVPAAPSGRLADLIALFHLQSHLDAMAAQLCPPARCRYHAALYDALAGALLLFAIMQIPAFAEASLSTLLESSVSDPAKRGAFRQGELF